MCWMFKYGTHYDYGDGVRDLYRLEVENFSSPLAVGLYIFAMVLVGLHLWHGVGELVPVAGPQRAPLHAVHPNCREGVGCR